MGESGLAHGVRGELQAHPAERTQILAAISHDLQTPLTRPRLRSELIEDQALRDKLLADLHALLDSLVCDCTDAGQPLALEGRQGPMLDTRPQAPRRLITNHVDNALKFAGEAQLVAGRDEQGVFIAVRDNGPGLGLAIAQQLAQALGGQLALPATRGLQ